MPEQAVATPGAAALINHPRHEFAPWVFDRSGRDAVGRSPTEVRALAQSCNGASARGRT